MFLKLSAKPYVYGTTTYPMVDFDLEMVVLSVFAFRLLLACKLLVLSQVVVVGPCHWRGCCLCFEDYCY